MLLRVCVILTFAVQVTAAQGVSKSFVIDASNPYVYLKFDHVGRRVPLSLSEPHEGLWLRLVNNCRVPVVVTLYNSGPDGLALFDEIIPAGPSISPAMGEGTMGPDGQPIEHQKEPEGKPPQGYSAEVSSTTSIQPGKSLLFSVPIDHVSLYWYLEVRVTLTPPDSHEVSEPETPLSFHWSDIPKSVRATLPH